MLQILPRVAPQKTLTCAATWSIHVILFHLWMIVALGAFLWTLETLARLGVTCHVGRVTAILSLFGLSAEDTDRSWRWMDKAEAAAWATPAVLAALAALAAARVMVVWPMAALAAAWWAVPAVAWAVVAAWAAHAVAWAVPVAAWWCRWCQWCHWVAGRESEPVFFPKECSRSHTWGSYGSG